MLEAGKSGGVGSERAWVAGANMQLDESPRFYCSLAQWRDYSSQLCSGEELVGSKLKEMTRIWKYRLPALFSLRSMPMLKYCALAHRNIWVFYVHQKMRKIL